MHIGKRIDGGELKKRLLIVLRWFLYLYSLGKFS